MIYLFFFVEPEIYFDSKIQPLAIERGGGNILEPPKIYVAL